MSKQDDQITGAKEDAAELQPEMSPAGTSTRTDSTVGLSTVESPSTGGSADDGGARRSSGNEGIVERISRFLRETRAELRRVSWPSANEVKNTTIITIIAVIFFALYLYGVDLGLAFLITQLERLVNWLVGAV